MTEQEFDEIRQSSISIYNEFMSKLTDEDKVNITRFVAGAVDYIQRTYVKVCPFDIINTFKETYPDWYEELKDLFRNFPGAITNQKVNYSQITSELKLNNMEEPTEVSFVTMMILKDKNASAGGKIHFSHNGGIIMCIIPQNSVMLSTFVIAHEISHQVIDVLELERVTDEDNALYIATEMIADYFAAFAYSRLLHSTSKNVKNNLEQMIPVLTANGDFENRADCMIREEQLKLIADKITTLM